MIARVVDKVKGIIGYKRLEEQLKQRDYDIIQMGQRVIDLQRQVKVMRNEKIRIVFVCHRPQIWDSLEALCEKCMEDDAFDVTIVTIPNKKQLPELGLHHEQYMSEGAEEYFKNYPCRVIQGYDYDAKEWIDLRSLHPDYLFFQTPYDICRPPEYHACEVVKFTNLCWIHYALCFIGGDVVESSTPGYYLKYVKNIFIEAKEMMGFYKKQTEESPISNQQNILWLGYPRLDNLENKMQRKNDSWCHDRGGAYRILWLPRWCTEEGNCCFFDYKDKLVDFVDGQRGFDLLFRPHPQMFRNFTATGEMSEQEIKDYQQKIEESANAAFDQEEDYWKAFATTDVLVADATSLLSEFFITGKPVIYCHKENDSFIGVGEAVYEGFYVANNWEELEENLELLRTGKDPLKATREKLIKEIYDIPEKGAAYEIKEYLKRQFYEI